VYRYLALNGFEYSTYKKHTDHNIEFENALLNAPYNCCVQLFLLKRSEISIITCKPVLYVAPEEGN
jgi:hypothetical protein